MRILPITSLKPKQQQLHDSPKINMQIDTEKFKPKVWQHFKINPVLKIDETVYKQAESMYFVYLNIF